MGGSFGCSHPPTGRNKQLVPVSYTHLDVYKRQGQGESGKTIDMYKRFIDFAASQKLSYYVMDSGWAIYEGNGASIDVYKRQGSVSLLKEHRA